MNPISYIAILGRQPKLGLAELEGRFGSAAVTSLSDEAALLTTSRPVDINLLGGSVKIARVHETTAGNAWLGVSKKTAEWLTRELASQSGKVTIGISAYGFDVGPRDVQKTGLVIKQRLKNRDGSVRLIPNTEVALSSAQVFHNKLAGGRSKREIIIVRGAGGHGYIAETIAVQDIDAYTLRDRNRPKRDPLNGMLPPKLAQMMLNLASAEGRVLDPFCGTGVVLMEAATRGNELYGTDLNEKMISFTAENLRWYGALQGRDFPARLASADATSATWEQPIGTVVSETYLGEPMAQPPAPEKLARVMAKCEAIVSGFLTNIAPQLSPGTRLCLAVPAWRVDGTVKHLQAVDGLEDMGYNWIDFEHVERSDLLYFREDQIVARELLVITRG